MRLAIGLVQQAPALDIALAYPTRGPQEIAFDHDAGNLALGLAAQLEWIATGVEHPTLPLLAQLGARLEDASLDREVVPVGSVVQRGKELSG